MVAIILLLFVLSPICKLYIGVVVLIPTLPLLSILILSTLLDIKAIEPLLTKHKPALLATLLKLVNVPFWFDIIPPHFT